MYEFHFTVAPEQYEAFKEFNKLRNIKLMRLVGNGLDTHQNSLRVKTNDWKYEMLLVKMDLIEQGFRIVRTKVETTLNTTDNVLYYEAHWKGVANYKLEDPEKDGFLWCNDLEYDNPKLTYRCNNLNEVVEAAKTKFNGYRCDAVEAVIYDDNRELDMIWENRNKYHKGITNVYS